MNTLALTIQTIGEICVGLAVLIVHHRVLNEHKIDQKVIRTLRSEQVLGVVGILLIIVGFILHVSG